MIRLKVTRKLLHSIQNDLERPHPFAAERIGYARCNHSVIQGQHLIFIASYDPFPDEQYINDPTVGARIDDKAIRTMMQQTLTTKMGILHVHMHDHRGMPSFSRTDMRELPQMMQSCRHTNPKAAHGGLVVSRDSLIALIWLPNQQEACLVKRATIVSSRLERLPKEDGNHYDFRI